VGGGGGAGVSAGVGLPLVGAGPQGGCGGGGGGGMHIFVLPQLNFGSYFQARPEGDLSRPDNPICCC